MDEAIQKADLSIEEVVAQNEQLRSALEAKDVTGHSIPFFI